jgi:hypothetical protein
MAQLAMDCIANQKQSGYMFALVFLVVLGALLFAVHAKSDKSVRRSMKVGYPFDPFGPRKF